MKRLTPHNGWAPELIRWYEAVKRDLPWRRTGDPYAVWISEIMLQQTRVEAVISYYRRFLQAFPDVRALAAASEDTVLKAWEGLGYYSRARNLHKAARTVSQTIGGVFPGSFAEIRKLPGIGDYTAGAIASIAFGEPVPAVDGNVKRVTSRLFGIRENVNQPAVLRMMRDRLTEAIPSGQASPFNQALMELGATVCIPRAPRCESCPLSDFCDAYAAGDAENLPVVDRKKPPREVSVAVCLTTYQNTVLVFKRKERMLQGLYVFALAEDLSSPADAQAYWADRGLETRFIARLGGAKHVFTHRVWNMDILHFELIRKPDAGFLAENDALLADQTQLKALPLPTAMKAAKEAALRIL
jgi:A/G-specific adenine glycosylase